MLGEEVEEEERQEEKGDKEEVEVKGKEDLCVLRFTNLHGQFEVVKNV